MVINKNFYKSRKQMKNYNEGWFVDNEKGWSFGLDGKRKAKLNHLIKMLDFKETNSVLDVGAGAGVFLSEIVKRKKIQQPMAVDISENAIKILTERVNNPRLVAVACSADKLPFASNSIDKVYSIELTEHVPFPEKVIKEMARVLKPKGLMYFDIPYETSLTSKVGKKSLQELLEDEAKVRGHIAFPKREEVLKWVEQSGCEIIDEITPSDFFPLIVKRHNFLISRLAGHGSLKESAERRKQELSKPKTPARKNLARDFLLKFLNEYYCALYGLSFIFQRKKNNAHNAVILARKK